MNAVAAERELSRFLCARLAVERELFFRTVTHLPHHAVLNAWDNHAFAVFEQPLRHAPRPNRLVPETEQRWSRVA